MYVLCLWPVIGSNSYISTKTRISNSFHNLLGLGGPQYSNEPFRWSFHGWEFLLYKGFVLVLISIFLPPLQLASTLLKSQKSRKNCWGRSHRYLKVQDFTIHCAVGSPIIDVKQVRGEGIVTCDAMFESISKTGGWGSENLQIYVTSLIDNPFCTISASVFC